MKKCPGCLPAVAVVGPAGGGRRPLVLDHRPRGAGPLRRCLGLSLRARSCAIQEGFRKGGRCSEMGHRRRWEQTRFQSFVAKATLLKRTGRAEPNWGGSPTLVLCIEISNAPCTEIGFHITKVDTNGEERKFCGQETAQAHRRQRTWLVWALEKGASVSSGGWTYVPRNFQRDTNSLHSGHCTATGSMSGVGHLSGGGIEVKHCLSVEGPRRAGLKLQQKGENEQTFARHKPLDHALGLGEL